jgi:hypothetical protein
MGVEVFKPTVWAAEIEHQLSKLMVYGQLSVTNRDFSGEIQYKKSVKITGVGPVTVKNYPETADMDAPEGLTAAELEMVINYRKYFSFYVDDIDQSQTSIAIQTQGMQEAMYALKDGIDQILGGLYTDAKVANCLGTDASAKVPNLTVADVQNIYNLIEDCGTLLSDSKVPKEGRYMIVPPWISAMIAKDLKIAGAAAPTMGQEAVRNGFVTRIAGFDILESHNVPNTAGAKYKCLFGTSRAITFAEQISKVRAKEMEKRFGYRIDGLSTFGCKVVRPEYLGVLTVSKT